MRQLTLALWLLLAGALAAAPPTIAIPKEAKGEPGEFVRLDAATEGTMVRWFALDKGLNVFPSELLRDSKSTVVVAVKAGTYRVAAITCKGDELSELAVGYVVIGTPEPTPPPAPPAPPAPPDDPLAAEVGRLYSADPDPRKAGHAAALAAFYRQGALACTSPDLATAGQLHDLLRRAAAGLIPDGALAGVRGKVSAELKALLPADPQAPLTARHRADAAALFGRLAQILGGYARGSR